MKYVLLDSLATRRNISEIKQKLLQTNVDDLVIVSFSGHGLVDKNFDFYYATYDIDFNNPEYNGFAYSEIEKLLDSIPARKKLVLMDACHSGEIDKEEDILISYKNPNIKEIDSKGVAFFESSNSLTRTNSFELMQDLFANLSKGNGAVVISASGGREFAYEGQAWNNGVFTYCIRQALIDHSADANNDGKTTVSELKTYVYSEVTKLTNGRQKPTSRQENLEFDFKVW